MKYKLRVDSSDQIQIRIFEIHNLKRFFFGGGGREREGIEKKYFWQALSRKKWYATDASHVSKPMLVAPC